MFLASVKYYLYQFFRPSYLYTNPRFPIATAVFQLWSFPQALLNTSIASSQCLIDLSYYFKHFSLFAKQVKHYPIYTVSLPLFACCFTTNDLYYITSTFNSFFLICQTTFYQNIHSRGSSKWIPHAGECFPSFSKLYQEHLIDTIMPFYGKLPTCLFFTWPSSCKYCRVITKSLT